MPKSTSLNFTQNLANPSVVFNSADILSVVLVSPNSNGTNLTAGTRTFTAASGTLQTGGSATTWTATVTDSRVIGLPTITQRGQYLVTPTASANAATVDSGSSNATWNLRVEIVKDVYTATSNDAVVKALGAVSFDSAARTASIWIIGTDNQASLVGTVSVGATSTVDLLNLGYFPFDTNGKRVLALKAGQKLAVSFPSITAATQIHVVAQVEEY